MKPAIHTIADLKSQARSLRDTDPNLSNSAALESLAAQLGYRDWNTLRAAAVDWAVGDRIKGRYLGHAFVGKILDLAAIGANFRITVQFDDPVDVVSSPHFSNLRQRVTAVVNGQGRSAECTSDGQPQMVIG